MATIYCKLYGVPEYGCSSMIEVLDELVTGATNYLCSHHLRTLQVRMNNREYDPLRDEADKAVRFQEHQFDPDLRRSAKPQGTSHVRGQGNEKRRIPENEEDRR